MIVMNISYNILDKFSILRLRDDGNLVIHAAKWKFQRRYFALFGTMSTYTLSEIWGDGPPFPKLNNQNDKGVKKVYRADDMATPRMHY
jgi:hypothetical protein